MKPNRDRDADTSTRRFIAELFIDGTEGKQIDCNPAFRSLQTTFISGTPGNVRLQFFASEETIQGAGVIGGGTIANMLDCAIGVAVLSRLGPGQNCATANLSVNMFRAGMSGHFTVEAKVERLGRRMAFAEARLFDEKEKLIATATSALAVLPT